MVYEIMSKIVFSLKEMLVKNVKFLRVHSLLWQQVLSANQLSSLTIHVMIIIAGDEEPPSGYLGRT